MNSRRPGDPAPQTVEDCVRHVAKTIIFSRSPLSGGRRKVKLDHDRPLDVHQEGWTATLSPREWDHMVLHRELQHLFGISTASGYAELHVC